MSREPDRFDRLRDRVLAGPAVPNDAPPDERRSAFTAWWFLASRLAMLGDEAPFRTWPSVASGLGIDAVEAIAEAARVGVRTLGDGAGDPLAEAIIDAEDAGCLRQMESRTTSLLPGLESIVDPWLQAAEEAVLDEDAAEVVREHADAYPLPEACRLPVVQTPLTDLEVLAAGASATWSKPIRLAEVFEFEESMALFHDGRPTETMRRRFAERRGEGVTPADAVLRVLPQLDEFWAVVIRVTGDAARRVRSVRLGAWPLQRVDTLDSVAESAWEAGDAADGADVAVFETVLARLPFADRMRLIRSEIGITTDDGGRFLL